MTNFFYWLYLWQNKEYRMDRMKLYFSSIPRPQWARLWFVGLRRRPHITIKIVLIGAVALLFMFIGVVAGMSFYIPWPIAVILSYMLVPLYVSVTVGLFSVPSQCVVGLLVLFASVKIKRFPSLMVIGVTGSYGKSSTKEAIATVLSQKYSVLKTKGSVNTKVGIALQVLKELNSQYDVYVVEMGAYKRGEIKEMAEIVRPRLGVITGINEQHVGLFGGIQNTILAKYEMADAVPSDGAVFLNIADTNVFNNMDRTNKNIQKYSSTRPEENINAANAIARYLGLSDEQIKRGFDELYQKQYSLKRMEQIHMDNGLIVINDSYSSNPAGFRAAVDKMNSYNREVEIVVATGVIDLGEVSDEINSVLFNYAAERSSIVFVVNPQFIKPNTAAQYIDTPTQVLELLSEVNPKDTILLLEGRHRVINQLKEKLKIAS